LHDLPLVALGAALAERGVTAELLPTSARIADLTDEAVRHRALIVLYAHAFDERWGSIPRIWPPEAPLLLAGPGWARARLPTFAGHTDDLADALRAVLERLPR
jgi:hypothetical protein